MNKENSSTTGFGKQTLRRWECLPSLSALRKTSENNNVPLWSFSSWEMESVRWCLPGLSLFFRTPTLGRVDGCRSRVCFAPYSGEALLSWGEEEESVWFECELIVKAEDRSGSKTVMNYKQRWNKEGASIVFLS